MQLDGIHHITCITAEFPALAPGRAGAGMIHRLRWRVDSKEALGFWRERLERLLTPLENPRAKATQA